MTAQSDVGRLLAEILADPASEAARLVYADHLIELGDPRGELVHAQCKFEKIEWDEPARRVIDERIADLLAMHESEWTRDVRALGFDDHLQQVSLRRGFVEKVTLDAKDAARLVPMLRAITPLRELHVTAKDDSHIDDVGVAADLEALSFRSFARGVDRAVANRLPHWPYRGKLQTLHVVGPDAAQAIAITPALASLRRIRVGAITAAGMSALADASHLDQVHTLELPQSTLGAAGLDTLARGKLTGLKRLQLEQARIVGDEIGSLAQSPLATQMQQLRVHHNRLGEKGARWLATKFPALELLDVESAELRASGTLALLSSKNLTKLASLDISRNAIGDGLVAALDAVELPALRHLACLQNALEASTAVALARCGLDELRSLDLSENPLLDASVIALAETTRLPKLDVLRIKATGIGARGLAALGASALGARLRAIDVARNEVDDHGLAALLESGNLAALDALDLANSALTIRGVKTLVAAPVAARIKHLTVTGLDVGALDPLLSADLPELRSLVADRFDDDAARLLATARGLPALHSMVFTARDLTDAGARALAESPQLTRVLWFELDAPNVTEMGRAMLRHRFGHHVAVFAGGTLQAFSGLGRRV
ncbi:MAG: TIGR02996 domain-containing protein [Myxococcota bacterium]|nr:TIGR02996 domain-containing protein [Myxococcota bacterium]